MLLEKSFTGGELTSPRWIARFFEAEPASGYGEDLAANPAGRAHCPRLQTETRT